MFTTKRHKPRTNMCKPDLIFFVVLLDNKVSFKAKKSFSKAV